MTEQTPKPKHLITIVTTGVIVIGLIVYLLFMFTHDRLTAAVKMDTPGITNLKVISKDHTDLGDELQVTQRMTFRDQYDRKQDKRISTTERFVSLR